MRLGKKINKKNNIYLLFIVFSTFIMSIGYAAVNSVSLNLKGSLNVYNSTGVLITDVKYSESKGADVTLSKVNSYVGTFFDNDVVFT